MYIFPRTGGRDVLEKLNQSTDMRAALLSAHDLVTEAIAQLDGAGAPADIAAHLDTALHRITRNLATE